jgi:hypothetical protein
MEMRVFDALPGSRADTCLRPRPRSLGKNQCSHGRLNRNCAEQINRPQETTDALNHRPYNARRMLMHRLKAAVLCALLTSGAILGTMPSCGRTITQAGPVCCRNEATCPMHQKHSSFGFNACTRDRAAASAVMTPYRAVFATALIVVDAPHRDHVFATKTILLPSASIAPGTPPPRLG